MKFTERITDIIRLRSLLIQERGLKCSLKITGQVSSVVAPYTGAWIEIHSHSVNLSNTHVAPYTGAWIEISGGQVQFTAQKSLLIQERGLK